jgi:hypothetical protein
MVEVDENEITTSWNIVKKKSENEHTPKSYFVFKIT